MILRKTSMLWSDNAGPASNIASAGPCPMPLSISPRRIGTSVSVAKYISAPVNEAKKFVHTGQIEKGEHLPGIFGSGTDVASDEGIIGFEQLRKILV